MKNPILMAPLAFLAGGFWVNTILDNFNSQKSHNALFRGILYYLRNDEEANRLIGRMLDYNEKKHPHVKGFVDRIKGVAELEFQVEGDQGKGLVKFIGNRDKQTDFWLSKHFSLETEGKTIKY
jgi:hypothetical protein